MELYKRGRNGKMSYCVKCGAKVDDGIMTCPQCGAKIPIISGSYAGSQNGYGDNGMNGQSADRQYTYGQQDHSQGSQQDYGQGGQQNGYQQTSHQQYGYQTQYYGTEEYFDQNEVRQNKGMGVLAYLGILVIIPLLAGDKRSEYVKHHVNQGLVLFILSSLVDLVEGEWVWGLHSIIHFGGGIFSWVFDILGLVFLVLMVMGIVTACKGERKELPFIGKIKFFK